MTRERFNKTKRAREIHEVLSQRMLEFAENPESNAAQLNLVRQYLKDIGHLVPANRSPADEAIPKTGTRREEVPDSLPEDFPFPGGAD